MPNRREDDPQETFPRIESLIRLLDTHPERTARETARELLTLVLDLHGLALAKLMNIVMSSEGAAPVLARMLEDKQVQAILLLHGLHPDDLETRVRLAVDRLHPHVGVLGLRLDIVSIADGTVRLRVRRGDGGEIEAPLKWTLRGEIEEAIIEAAPDVVALVLDGVDFEEAGNSVRTAADL
jgi:hypothetical protein